MLTQDRLKELLCYNRETGNFTRLIGRSGPNARQGDIAGSINKTGYIRIYVDGVGYKAHRLAIFYETGEWPDEVDHINGDPSDNRYENLRSVSRAENNMNQKVYRNNSSGLRGVSLWKKTGKWKAQIQKSGKKTFLGYFDTKEAASQAYEQAASELFGEYKRAL